MTRVPPFWTSQFRRSRPQKRTREAGRPRSPLHAPGPGPTTVETTTGSKRLVRCRFALRGQANVGHQSEQRTGSDVHNRVRFIQVLRTSHIDGHKRRSTLNDLFVDGLNNDSRDVCCLRTVVLAGGRRALLVVWRCCFVAKPQLFPSEARSLVCRRKAQLTRYSGSGDEVLASPGGASAYAFVADVQSGAPTA